MAHFLLLQGPHGPFFAELAARLRGSGHHVSRVAFNEGDVREWPDARTLHRYADAPRDFAPWLAALCEALGISDVLLYGDHRWMHRDAADIARAQGLRLHYLEEGYLRPHWITYERDGVNGTSRLMSLTPESILAHAQALAPRDRPAPDQWGAMGSHLWHGLRYHRAAAAGARRWGGPYPTRAIPLRDECSHALRALLDLPLRALRRRLAQGALLRAGAPYHVALLQLGHDASVQAHSSYSCMAGFMEDVARGFASGAPAHHHLVFKMHPFEDGRERLSQVARRLARDHGLTGRMHVLEGERLAVLLDGATSAVTINSTAAQQALWRGLPVRASGRAIYGKPGLVSSQGMAEFFAGPDPTDMELYRAFRRLLLATSQIKGGFYTASGRATLLRGLLDPLLAAQGPYSALDRDLAATDTIILDFSRKNAR